MSNEFDSDHLAAAGFSYSQVSRFDPFGDIDPALVSDCNAMLARLYSFLDGELNDDRRAKIQRHLDDCPSCFSKFDFEAELRIVIAKRVVCRVPESLVQRIRISICTPTDDDEGAS
jgi:mycothiol system anti-sigma-R factor